MIYTVELTHAALADAREHLEYLDGRSNFQDVGQQWWEGLRTALQSLREMQQRCPLFPEIHRDQMERRYLMFGSHRIVFQVSHPRARVVVLRILHAARRAQ